MNRILYFEMQLIVIFLIPTNIIQRMVSVRKEPNSHADFILIIFSAFYIDGASSILKKTRLSFYLQDDEAKYFWEMNSKLIQPRDLLFSRTF